MFVGHFNNKNTQFYGYRLFSDVKITPFFSNIFFGLHPKVYSQISNCTSAKAQAFRKRYLLNILSGSKYFNVTEHFRAVSQTKTECENRHILSRFETCPARPCPQAEKWPYQACYYFKLHKRGGLICAHAPILFLLCMVNAFILTTIKMHLHMYLF